MQQGDLAALCVGLFVVGTALSCWIAVLAARDTASWAWGIVGPAGWIVAAVLGVERRRLETTHLGSGKLLDETSRLRKSVEDAAAADADARAILREIGAGLTTMSAQLNELLNALPDK